MTTTIYDPIPYYGYQYGPGDPMRTCTRDLQALELLRQDLHKEFPNDYDKPLYIFQGAYHDGGNSAGTHLGSSVYDLHPSDFEAKARLGAKHGIIVFHRLPLPNKWGEHLHVLIRGGQKMHPEARAQVADWDKHLDGMADHAQYDTGPQFPWFEVKPFTYHAHGKGGGGDQGGNGGAGSDPWGTIALTEALGGHHNNGVRVTTELDQLLTKHPNAREWKALRDRHVARQAELTADHTRAWHLSHQS